MVCSLVETNKRYLLQSVSFLFFISLFYNLKFILIFRTWTQEKNCDCAGFIVEFEDREINAEKIKGTFKRRNELVDNENNFIPIPEVNNEGQIIVEIDEKEEMPLLKSKNGKYYHQGDLICPEDQELKR